MTNQPTSDVWRRDFYLSALIIIFNVLQLWALVVVLSIFHPTGTALIAFALLMAGNVLGVVAGWRYLARQDRHQISAPARQPFEFTPAYDQWPNATTHTGSTIGSSATRSIHASPLF